MNPKTRKLLGRILEGGNTETLSEEELSFLQTQCLTKKPANEESDTIPLMRLIGPNLLRYFLHVGEIVIGNDEDMETVIQPARVTREDIPEAFASMVDLVDIRALRQSLLDQIRQDESLHCARNAACLIGLCGFDDLVPALLSELPAPGASDDRFDFPEYAFFSLTILGCREIEAHAHHWLKTAAGDSDEIALALLFADRNPDLFEDREILDAFSKLDSENTKRTSIGLAERAVAVGFQLGELDAWWDEGWTRAQTKILVNCAPEASIDIEELLYGTIGKIRLCDELIRSGRLEVLKPSDDDEQDELTLFDLARQIAGKPPLPSLPDRSDPRGMNILSFTAYLCDILRAKDPMETATGYDQRLKDDNLMLTATHYHEALLLLLRGRPVEEAEHAFIAGVADQHDTDDTYAFILAVEQLGLEMPSVAKQFRELLDADDLYACYEVFKTNPFTPGDLELFENSFNILDVWTQGNQGFPGAMWMAWCHASPPNLLEAAPEYITKICSANTDVALFLGGVIASIGLPLPPNVRDLILLLRQAAEDKASKSSLSPQAGLLALIDADRSVALVSLSTLLPAIETNQDLFRQLLLGVKVEAHYDELKKILQDLDPARVECPLLLDLAGLARGEISSLDGFNSLDRVAASPCILPRRMLAEWFASEQFQHNEESERTKAIELLERFVREAQKIVAAPAMLALLRIDPQRQWIWDYALHQLSVPGDSENAKQLIKILRLKPSPKVAATLHEIIEKGIMMHFHTIEEDHFMLQREEIINELPDGYFGLHGKDMDGIIRAFGCGNADKMDRLHYSMQDKQKEFLIERLVAIADKSLVERSKNNAVLLQFNPSSDEAPAHPIAKKEFWAIAAHLEVNYVDEDEAMIQCKVSAKATCEVVNALLEKRDFAFFSAEWA